MYNGNNKKKYNMFVYLYLMVTIQNLHFWKKKSCLGSSICNWTIVHLRK